MTQKHSPIPRTLEEAVKAGYEIDGENMRITKVRGNVETMKGKAILKGHGRYIEIPAAQTTRYNLRGIFASRRGWKKDIPIEQDKLAYLGDHLHVWDSDDRTLATKYPGVDRQQQYEAADLWLDSNEQPNNLWKFLLGWFRQKYGSRKLRCTDTEFLRMAGIDSSSFQA